MISKEVFEELIELGILNHLGKIEPEAYSSKVLRAPLDKQAKILGLNLFVKNQKKIRKSVESDLFTYLNNKVNGQLFLDEGFSILTILKTICPFFPTNKKALELSPFEIQEQCKSILKFTEWELLNHIEVNVMFNWYGANPEFPINEVCERIDSNVLKRRQSGIICEGVKLNLRNSDYIKLVNKWLVLWRSLNREIWYKLTISTITNWPKMAVGWPDLTIASEDNGLTLIEIKGKDKLHNNQIFTLLKLQDVLGQSAVVIGWVTDSFVTREYDLIYKNELFEWLNDKTSIRGSFTKRKKDFTKRYCLRKHAHA